MNTENQLRRLFRSAAAASEPKSEAPSHWLEERVIARWRHGLRPDELLGWPVFVFRRALACAFVLMLLAVGYSFQHSDETPANEIALAEYETQLTMLP